MTPYTRLGGWGIRRNLTMPIRPIRRIRRIRPITGVRFRAGGPPGYNPPTMLRIPRLLSAVVLSAAALAVAPAPSGAGPVCRGPEVPLPRVCSSDLRNPQISCSLPADVQGGLRQPALYVRQRASDIFSWQVLIALDWPALRGRRGVPDPAKPIAAPGPRVWETWKEIGEVFREKDGQPVPPAPWDAPEALPAAGPRAAQGARHPAAVPSRLAMGPGALERRHDRLPDRHS